MMRMLMGASLLALAAVPMTAAAAQDMATAAVQPIRGTRLDVVATGEASRVPDIARINAGVVTIAATATEAIAQNAARMTTVRAALKRAGIAERDIQTSSINLSAEYRQEANAAPQLTGYRASNEAVITFRDIASSGRILDALVAQGANQINGPSLSIDRPEGALDEARTKALATARARADLYARALGRKVARIVSISEAGAVTSNPLPMYRMAAQDVSTSIAAGEQTLSVTLSVVFDID
jgi:uncharacterized protein YggE